MLASLPAPGLPWPLPLLRFLPLPLLQPILTLIGTQVAKAQPDVFRRLGGHAEKSFVIDPTDLPFVLVLQPRPEAPSLSAWRRINAPQSHARIAGSFLNLFDLIDGALDGDALFFSRKLRVTGDTEAVVALRNALDDVDGGVVESITRAFGPLSGVAAATVSHLRTLGERKEP
ncbi:ubiquinone anaerobic biosynthesis accessory factor UbiT [Bradyrhizobium sp. AZCC 1693]|uniref:ubiquinone anaerobic biosynthesis accessory factor UbiT n=1 Tax=Bradyrhizobium sp. AZCC 1693 TaxID=3117029 RepID=UPI002FF3A2E8